MTMEAINFGDARLPDKFWAKCIPVPFAGCWLWLGPLTNGYGRFKIEGPRAAKRRARAHRHAYIKLIGPVVSDLELDHRCVVKCCVNPLHLEPVTHRKNMQRSNVGWNYRDRTHCNKGHPFTPENTVFHKRPGREPTRACRTCCRERHEQRQAKLRQVNAERIKHLPTHCKRGHEFTPENTRLRKHPEGKTTRVCRTCGDEALKRYRAKKTARAAFG